MSIGSYILLKEVKKRRSIARFKAGGHPAQMGIPNRISKLPLVALLQSIVAGLCFHTAQGHESTIQTHAPVDLLVIGGTPAGIAAAIGAATLGKDILIIEQSPVLGGVHSSGVIRMDDLYAASNSGVMESFRRRVRDYHRTELASDPLVKAHRNLPANRPWNIAEGRAWEPHTAARIYSEMVGEHPSISTLFQQVAVDVIMEGHRVVGVVTRDRDNQGNLGQQHTYRAKVIIDATYEGDLAAFAKIPYRIGREARSPEEPHAGRIYTNYFRHVAGVPSNTILPHSTGEPDHRSQAFTYRLTGKDYGRPDHPFRIQEPPPGYDASLYRWNRNTKPIIPNRKFDLLGISWGGDLTGHGTRWVLADWEERKELESIFRQYDLGWLYYIQTEGQSPQIGLPDDEFTDNHHLPYRLYVRQGRRIEGHETLNESDIHKDLRGNGLRGPLNANSVAIGVYGIDAHNVQGPTRSPEPPSGEGAAEGTLHLFDVTGPYQIPYGVMVPKSHQGILFPIGISSTHVAMCTVRMEPVWAALGQAAGVAAALSMDQGVELAQVPTVSIQQELVRQGCQLFFYNDLAAEAPCFEAVQLLSLKGAMDDRTIEQFPLKSTANTLSDLDFEAYRFRPDAPVTMGAFAQMALEGLGIPWSITAAHFQDVRRGHQAFPYIETLYDLSSQSTKPFFPFETHASKEGSNSRTELLARPENPVSHAQALKILKGLLHEEFAWPSSLPKSLSLTRGQAAMLIFEATQWVSEKKAVSRRLPDFRRGHRGLRATPFLIAHRGGVIASDSPEGSLTAIERAAREGYDMVELDLQQSTDGVPIVFHDHDLVKACGREGKIIDWTAKQLTSMRTLIGDQPLITLETALNACQSLGLGVMLDLKTHQKDPGFLHTIGESLKRHGLANASLCITGEPATRRHLRHTRFTLTADELKALRQGDRIELSDRFWFGLPSQLQAGDIQKLQAAGVLVLPAINTFRYPANRHHEEAEADIKALIRQGVDGFQIDSIYQEWFGLKSGR